MSDFVEKGNQNQGLRNPGFAVIMIIDHSWKEVLLTDYERMKSKYESLEKQIYSLATQLKRFPKGKLICTRNGTRYKWYRSDGHTQTYIPKKNRELAESLAVKKYLTLQKQNLEQEKKAVESYLKRYPQINEAEKLLAEKSGYLDLLSPYFKPISEELSEWAEAPYDKNPNYIEQLNQKTGGGIRVRSKSEAMIGMVLHMRKIPFRYECLLELGGIAFYPDFTIRHPVTGNVIYWEHFGMMDDPEYCRKTCSKLQIYTSYGIIPSINLITTYETRDDPLNMEMIEKIVEYYFM